MRKRFDLDENVVYCRCPGCAMLREKKDGHYTIIRRGQERSGAARFKCLNCGKWFNEHSSETMTWLSR